MNEDQIQTLLDYALNEGGLGAARAEYMDMLVSDASTAVFTVNAGGLAKTVSVYALGIDSPEVPDLQIRKVLATLRDRLLDIDQGGTVKTDVYAPDRYRAILLEGQPGAPDQKAWPWPEVKTAEFVSNGDPNAMPLPARVMTAAEIEALGIKPFEGGFVGLPLAGPGDGKFYTLVRSAAAPRRHKVGGERGRRCARWAVRRSLTHVECARSLAPRPPSPRRPGSPILGSPLP